MRPLAYGEENCTECWMTLEDDRYGAELLTRTGRAYPFDSIECLVAFLADQFELEQLGMAVLCSVTGLSMGVTLQALGIGWFSALFPVAFLLGGMGSYNGAVRSGPLA